MCLVEARVEKEDKNIQSPPPLATMLVHYTTQTLKLNATSQNEEMKERKADDCLFVQIYSTSSND